MKITYGILAPIIHAERDQRGLMVVEFKAANSPKIIESSAGIYKGQSTRNRVENIARIETMNQVQKSVSNLIRSTLGFGFAGRLISRAATEVMHDQKAIEQYSKKDKQEAVVRAFKRVQSNFSYDRAAGGWVLVEALSTFDKQRMDGPVQDKFDQEILGRMLVELAEAEGGINRKERGFLSKFVTEEDNMVDHFSLKQQISRAELQETSAKARNTIFMMATAMVLIDQDISAPEKSRLVQYAQMFDFGTDKTNELILEAKLYVLEMALHEMGTEREQVLEFADTIKLDHEEAERFAVRYRKRNDLIDL
ncbi:MAG: hypothetical protein AAFV80_03155 [Bacteroidota bacterium]